MTAYTINFSDPLKPSFTINAGGYNGPGSANAQSSLRLYGEAAIQWGESVDENMLRLNENFAGATPPYTPIGGQIWVRQSLYWNFGINWWAYNFASDTWVSITVNYAPPPLPADAYVGTYYYNAGVLYLSTSQYQQAAIAWLPREFTVGVAAPINGVDKPTQIAQVYNSFTQQWVSLSGNASNISVTSYPPAFTGPSVQDALQQLADGKVAKSGDTMTGFLTLNANPVAGLQAATKQYVDAAASGNVPAGTIVMWSPSAGPVPSGWAACDGTSGTPDLRDRWIVGAGGSYGAGSTGGSLTTIAAGTHNHGTDVQGSHSHGGLTANYTLTINDIPPHQHLAYTVYSGSAVPGFPFVSSSPWTMGGGTPDDPFVTYNTQSAGGGGGHAHGINADGLHSHTTTSAGSHTHTYTPPYYALIFIMKL